MRVYLYVDEFATINSSPEEEYEEIEEWFREQLPDADIKFHRKMMPHKLANASPDVYLFDIGGLCYVDHSGERRLNLCHEVLRQVEDHPSTLFIPWTSMTRDYLRYALEDMLPETAANTPPNVWCPPKVGMDLDYEAREALGNKLKEWHS